MKDITTWYKKQENGDYRYNHFSYGHTIENEEGWLYRNCYLDTRPKINKIVLHK